MPRYSKEENKAYWRLYYAVNREKIIARTTQYLKTHPEVVEKIRTKHVKSGKSVKYGRRDRQKLNDGYLRSLIEDGGIEKTLEQKKKEVLIFRIKKLLRELNNVK